MKCLWRKREIKHKHIPLHHICNGSIYKKVPNDNCIKHARCISHPAGSWVGGHVYSFTDAAREMDFYIYKTYYVLVRYVIFVSKHDLLEYVVYLFGRTVLHLHDR